MKSSGLDGLINLYKPPGISSAKALYRVRKLTGQRKSGHAGTLDPAAEGVLLLCLGKGTKLVERLMGLAKGYRAVARLDVTSESFDSDRPHEPVPIEHQPTLEAVNAAATQFIGTIEQVPPAISALKVGGRAAYKLVRSGETPELKARLVRIDRLKVLRYEWPELEFELDCGRGTYVRSLIRDWGAVLGVGGCLTKLERTYVGPFRSADGWTFKQLGAASLENYVHKLDDVEEMITPDS
jgi:tRNA pseudouridine55 synthase